MITSFSYQRGAEVTYGAKVTANIFNVTKIGKAAQNITRKPGRGLTVIAASTHVRLCQFSEVQNPRDLDIYLGSVKVISACTVPVVLPARPTI